MSESKKYLDFVRALKQLCKEHEVILSTSYHDGMQVWDAKGAPGIHCAGIDDMTGEDAESSQNLDGGKK